MWLHGVCLSAYMECFFFWLPLHHSAHWMLHVQLQGCVSASGKGMEQQRLHFDSAAVVKLSDVRLHFSSLTLAPLTNKPCTLMAFVCLFFEGGGGGVAHQVLWRHVWLCGVCLL
jgi:hypothetical protein